LKEPPFKAYATATSKQGEACGFSSGNETRESAVSQALRECRSAAKRFRIPAKLCRIREVKNAAPGQIPRRWRINGTGETLTLKEFKSKHGFSDQEMKQRFGAAGRIICPHVSGTIFLVNQSDVFITSDHIFLAKNEKTAELDPINKCYAEFFYSKGRFKIKADSIIHGYRVNKTAYKFDWYDWAVGKLQKEVVDIRPYSIAQHDISLEANVLVVSQGMKDSVARICAGTVTTAASVGIATTCASGSGASGGPVIAGTADQPVENPWVVVGLTFGSAYVMEFAGRPGGDYHTALPTHDADLMKAIDGLH
jgi:hypothetical protein